MLLVKKSSSVKSGMHLMIDTKIQSYVVCGRSILWTLKNIKSNKKRVFNVYVWACVLSEHCSHRHDINRYCKCVSKINEFNNQTKYKMPSKHFTNFHHKKAWVNQNYVYVLLFFSFKTLRLANHSILIIIP